MTIWDDIRQKALMKYQWGKVIAVTGRLGSGKTEFLLNLASAFKTIDEDVTVVDVDITNPYFCVREIAAKLQKEGYRVVTPPGAVSYTHLDVYKRQH